MKNLLKHEFTKAIKNKMFFFSLLIVTALCIYSAVFVIISYYDDINKINLIATQNECEVNPMIPAFTLYNKWIGQEWISFSSSLLFLLLPLTASLPFSWSFCKEKKIGYLNNLYIRTSPQKYLNTKYFVTFIVGVISILIPLFINLMIVSAFIPAVDPNVHYDIYYNMPVNCILSELFYTYPLLYIIIKLLIISLFSGAFAVLGQATGIIIKNKFVVVLFPFVFLLIFNYISSILSPTVELSPIQFLYGGGKILTNYWVIQLELSIFLLSSLIIIKFKGVNKDAL